MEAAVARQMPWAGAVRVFLGPSRASCPFAVHPVSMAAMLITTIAFNIILPLAISETYALPEPHARVDIDSIVAIQWDQGKSGIWGCGSWGCTGLSSARCGCGIIWGTWQKLLSALSS